MVINDTDRDALALVRAMAARDEEAAEAIITGTDLEPLAVTLAGMVVGALEVAGTDPVAWVAEVQRQILTGAA